MAEPFLGEVRQFAFGIIPKGWLPCNGQLLSIQQNQALYSLLGTMYGGNGTTNFAVPNLQGRVPLHKGNTITYGVAGGEAMHTLMINEIPTHTHQVNANADIGTQSSPKDNAWGLVNGRSIYATIPNADMTMNAAAMTVTGQSNAHNNMQPYLTISFCIAVQGIFPPRN